MSSDPAPVKMAACSWPELAEPYDVALREAVAFIFARFDVLGIVACGSIIRGNPDPRSDFDLYVMNSKPFRQRVQRVFAGVPAEIFVNPPGQIRQYFDIEKAEGRPRTAHMLARRVRRISTRCGGRSASGRSAQFDGAAISVF